MKKCSCPKCAKELIRLEPYEPGVYHFVCDVCELDIDISQTEIKPLRKNKTLAYHIGGMLSTAIFGGLLLLTVAVTIKLLSLILF